MEKNSISPLVWTPEKIKYMLFIFFISCFAFLIKFMRWMKENHMIKIKNTSDSASERFSSIYWPSDTEFSLVSFWWTFEQCAQAYKMPRMKPGWGQWWVIRDSLPALTVCWMESRSWRDVNEEGILVLQRLLHFQLSDKGISQWVSYKASSASMPPTSGQAKQLKAWHWPLLAEGKEGA